jgi:hypothetical protein
MQKSQGITHSSALWVLGVVKQAGSTVAREDRLVSAARKQRGQNHQVGQREQPLLRLCASRFGCSCDHAKMPATGEIVQVIHADARQTSHFRVCKDLLTRLNFYQGGLSISAAFAFNLSDAA